MKKVRIAINGFGRVGRLFFRQAFSLPEIELVAVNDLGDIENLAYLLKYDTVYRVFNKPVKADKNKSALVVDGKDVKVFQEKEPAKLPWKNLDIDIAVEATGLFDSFVKAKVHLDAGARRVVITAPAKDADGIEGGKTILVGVNDAEFAGCAISSNGSCTTNATAAVVAIMAENPGVEKAMLSTVHANTNTQSVVDSPTRGGEDFRAGRAASQNIIPFYTGAAISVTRGVPALVGKFDGLAFRIPVPTVSIADITFLAKRKVTAEEINDIFRRAAQEARWQGILKVVDEQVVSSDIIGEPYGAIVDLNFTRVVDGDLVKVLSWYDNEWGYCSTLLQHVLKVGKLMTK